MGNSLHTISRYFQATEDVLGRKVDMHKDAKQRRHSSLPHQDSGGPRLACSSWDSASTIRVSVIALNIVSKDWQVFVQSILGRDTLPGWDKMLINLQQELKQALLKSSIHGSSNSVSKGVKEEENVPLTSKGPS